MKIYSYEEKKRKREKRRRERNAYMKRFQLAGAI
jgi:translation initiation factor IF-3